MKNSLATLNCMASAYAAAAATKMSHPVSVLLTSAAVTADFYMF